MENEPRLAAAVTAALFSPDPAVAATRDGYTSIMRGWLAASVGPDEVPPEVEDVLEHVFFSTMVGLVNGRRPPSDVGDQLEQAARLLLAGT